MARRLAAIMFTDVVGYTARAQTDEAGSLELIREQQGLLRPLFKSHHGREVKSTGDGLLVEFSSALRAVQCAVQIQERLHERNSRGGGARLEIRIGIHLGDVEEQGRDILGDAVNIASRIQPVALPGGIAVSRQVFDQVNNKLSLAFEKLEPQALKGIEVPMEVYRLCLPWQVPSRAGAPAPSPPDSRRLVVLPFVNISPDPADEYFADGMTEELIEKLANASGLRVIARTTAMHYKSSRQTALEIGRELHAGNVVECSVRKVGTRIRISAQLIDTASEEHLWASRYDRELDDIFAIQDEISSQISTAISTRLGSKGSPELRVPPESRETKDVEAYTLFLHGLKLFRDKGSEESIRHALALLEDAVGRDPTFARAHVALAECLLWLGGEGAIPYAESVDQARSELARAVQLNETLPEAHSALAALLLGADETRSAEREASRALELSPSCVEAYRWLAQIAAGNGDIEEAVRLLEVALQLDPVNVDIIAFLGRAYFYSGREADALAHWERTKPMVTYRTNAYLAEYYLGKKDYARAEQMVRELERLRPQNVWTVTYRGFLAARQGDADEARRAISQLDQRAKSGELTVFCSGFICFALDDLDGFVARMEEAFQLHALPLLELSYSPLLRAARQDPRVVDLLRRQTELMRTSN